MKILYGSHNYNLNSENSDFDYAEFVYPTLDDLYDNTNLNRSVITDELDTRYIDMRAINNFFTKASFETIEFFNSSHVEFDIAAEKELYSLLQAKSKLALKYRRYEIAIRVFSQMKNKIKQATQPSPARQESIDKYGVDVKSLYTALRNMILYRRLLNNVVDEPTELLKFEGSERDYLIDIKSGSFSKSVYESILENIKSEYDYMAARLDSIIEKKIEQQNDSRYETEVLEPVAEAVKSIVLKRLKTQLKYENN